MRRIFLLFLAVLLMPLRSMAGQQMDIQSIKDKVFDIKLDARYLKEELQNEDEYNAREFAFQELLSNVNVGRKEKGQDSLLEKHLRPLVQFLSYKRSSTFKAFAYILISDVDKLSSGIPFGRCCDASRVPFESPPVVNSIASSPSVAKSQVLMSLTTIEWGPEISEALDVFKKADKISEFGKVSKAVAIGDSDYLIFFDSKLVMQAILQPLGGGKYKNYQTRMEETLDNYRGRGFAALWFRF